MRALLAGLLIAAAGCGATGEAEPEPKQPLLLMLPPGGFLLTAGPMSEARKLAIRRGFLVEQIDYVLGDPLGAWREVRRRAVRARENGRPVYAYGESAGGVLASLLAKRGIAAAAVSNAAPSNMTTWNNPAWPHLRNKGASTRRALSPVFGPTKNPVLLLDTPEVPATFRMNTVWARRDSMVRFSGYTGPHIYGDDHRAILREAMAFLGAHG
jgi:hypothetical protein